MGLLWSAGWFPFKSLCVGLLMKENCEGDQVCRVRCSVPRHFLEFAICTAPLYVGGLCIEWGDIIRVPPQTRSPSSFCTVSSLTRLKDMGDNLHCKQLKNVLDNDNRMMNIM